MFPLLRYYLLVFIISIAECSCGIKKYKKYLESKGTFFHLRHFSNTFVATPAEFCKTKERTSGRFVLMKCSLSTYQCGNLPPLMIPYPKSRLHVVFPQHEKYFFFINRLNYTACIIKRIACRYACQTWE